MNLKKLRQTNLMPLQYEYKNKSDVGQGEERENEIECPVTALSWDK